MLRGTTLTEGSIPAHLAALSLPLVLASLLQQLYNAVDALVIGRFSGTEAFAAIGVAGTVMNLFLFVVSGGCAGISVVFARLYGEGDLARFRRENFLALAFGGGAVLLLALAALGCTAPLLRAIHTPAEVAPIAAGYLHIVLAGLPAAFLYNLLAAMLRAVGRTRAALGALAAAIVSNLGLDLLLVGALQWGANGAAIATVAAQLLSAALCFGFLRAQPELLCRAGDARLDRALLRETLRQGSAAALHQSSLYIGKLLVQDAVNAAGTAAISAYTAATRIEGFANAFGISGADSSSIFVAQNLGAGKRARAHRGFLTAMGFQCALGALFSLLLYACAPAGIGFMLGGGGAALDSGVGYMRTVAPFYILCFAANAYIGLFRGSGRAVYPVIGTTLHISIRVLLSYLLIPKMALAGVALATGLGWIALILFQSAVYIAMRRNQRKKGAPAAPD